ncbi:hypothetical protein BJ944DRAFT_258267, partial [Cunninghamella echinulata]
MSTSLWHNSHDGMTLSYKKIIKQMAAQAPKAYGEIPPLTKKKKKKKSNHSLPVHQHPPSPISRRMSHVENWVVVDSKESLPDEEDLVQRSPLRNFLSIDFLTDVLPLHTPPASLSDSSTLVQQYEIAELANQLKETRLSSSSSSPLPSITNENEQQQVVFHQKEQLSIPKSPSVRRNSISSTSNAQIPSISTTPSSVISSNGYSSSSTTTPSSDLIQQQQQMKWIQNMNKLKRTLIEFGKQQQQLQLQEKKKKKIPMPLPSPSVINSYQQQQQQRKKRRSEATTQPRFNPETNTYTRDTRYNPDHLRMIAAELNMMRARKLLSPLKPRGFLPRRKDVVYLANDRRRSPLLNEITVD